MLFRSLPTFSTALLKAACASPLSDPKKRWSINTRYTVPDRSSRVVTLRQNKIHLLLITILKSESCMEEAEKRPNKDEQIQTCQAEFETMYQELLNKLYEKFGPITVDEAVRRSHQEHQNISE